MTLLLIVFSLLSRLQCSGAWRGLLGRRRPLHEVLQESGGQGNDPQHHAVGGDPRTDQGRRTFHSQQSHWLSIESRLRKPVGLLQWMVLTMIYSISRFCVLFVVKLTPTSILCLCMSSPIAFTGVMSLLAVS